MFKNNGCGWKLISKKVSTHTKSFFFLLTQSLNNDRAIESLLVDKWNMSLFANWSRSTIRLLSLVFYFLICISLLLSFRSIGVSQEKMLFYSIMGESGILWSRFVVTRNKIPMIKFMLSTTHVFVFWFRISIEDCLFCSIVSRAKLLVI